MATHTLTPAATTRREVLEAAAEVFAARGFRDATLREICRRAGANVAAVSYHFGDKARLYSAVLRETGSFTGVGPETTTTPPSPADAAAAAAALPPEARLESFIRFLLGRILSEGPAALHGQIMAREMIEPTRALDRVVAEFIRPQSEWLLGILQELVGPGLPLRVLRRLGLSVVSQILFYKHCRPVLERLYPGECPGEAQLDELTAHITAFTLAGLQGFVRPAPPARPQRRASTRSHR
jgi:AcrR family transcriptional regulator